MVVQITTAFPSVPQVQSALCPGVTGITCSTAVCQGGGVALCWFLNLHHPFLNQEANTTGVLLTIDGTIVCVLRHTGFPSGFRSQARYFLSGVRPPVIHLLCEDEPGAHDGPAPSVAYLCRRCILSWRRE
jgi:hypothetical protein